MLLFYNIIIKFYQLAIFFISPFNEKAEKWRIGRNNIFYKIKKLENVNEQRYWFHCASLGEFEQGRPLIEKIKIQNPEIKIIITFFSPSGYLHTQDYKFADYIFYLPIDTNKNAERFIKYIKPEKVFFIKYEFWYHYLNQLSKNKIPTYLVSGIFSKKQLFFKRYGAWYKKILNKFTYIFVQNKESKQLLENEGLLNVLVSGDTRFDRVFEIAQENKSLPIIERFKLNKFLVVFGSSWENDENIIIDYINSNPNNFKFIIAPHDVSSKNISRVCSKLDNYIKYTDVESYNETADVLVIDVIGILSKIYKYADISYVGGGFGEGIHNILEANVFGCPVIFGPNYKKFSEAIECIELGTAFSINNKIEFENKINYLYSSEQILKSIKKMSKQYFVNKKGASDKILKNIS